MIYTLFEILKYHLSNAIYKAIFILGHLSHFIMTWHTCVYMSD